MDKIILKVLMIFLVSSFLASCKSTPKVNLTKGAGMLMELNRQAWIVNSVDFSPDGKYALSGGRDKTVRLWDVTTGKQIRTFKMDTGIFTSAIFSPDGRYVLSAGSDATINLWDISTGKKIWQFRHEGVVASFYQVYSVAFSFSPDGKYLLSGGRDGILHLWDVSSGKEIRQFTHGPPINSVTFSPDGRYALSGGPGMVIHLWDIQTWERIRSFTGCSSSSLSFSPDGRHFVAGCLEVEFYQFRSSINYYDISIEAPIRQTPIASWPKRAFVTVDFSPDGKYILSGIEEVWGGYIKLWDASTGKEIRTFKEYSSRATSVAFSPDGRYALSGGGDASIGIWDVSTGEEVAMMVGFEDDEWIVITREGYYNSSEKGAQYLSVKVGEKKYDTNLFYDVFYRPDIVMAKLRGEDIKGLVTITMDDAIKTPPPSVEFAAVPKDTDQSKVKVCYKAKSTGGGIGEVRLFNNGKLIQSDGYYKDVAKSTTEKAKLLALNSKAIYEDMKRGIAIKEKMDISSMASKSKGDIFEDCGEIDAVSGENEVSITAFNSNNTVQSPMKTISFNSKIPSVEPHLYILSVGIDQYKDSSVNLKYAVKDANDIKEKILMQASTLYKPQNIHYELLTDKDATKINILNRVNELSSKIKAADSFILFVAGHGVLLQNQYFMLTHEYDGGLSDNILISANEIVEMSKKIKSLSQLLIFDTCHAGGVDYIVSGLYDARMSVLAKKMGLHIYASASSLQEAMDGYNGNGLFSHALLDGLNNNKGADKNSDGKVSLVELGGHSKMTTVEISKKIGHTQTPLIINFGKDNAVYSLGR